MWGFPLCLGNKAVPRVTQPKQASFVLLPGGSEGKVSACNAGDSGSIPGLGRFPGDSPGDSLEKESDATERLHFHFLYSKPHLPP